MGKYSKDQINNVKSLVLKKVSQREISKLTKVPKTNIARIAAQLNTVTEGKTGRPKKLNSRDITFCTTKLASGKVKTAQSLTKTLQIEKGIKLHRSTLSRALHLAGMKAGDKKKKHALSQKNIKSRLSFAKYYSNWTVEDWKTVIFSDETKINRFNSDGRTWTWYRDGESLQPRNVSQTTKHGGGGLMLWGCITQFGVGYLCEIEGIMDQHLYKQILEGELKDTFQYYGLEKEDYTFQHDNDPKHTAKSIKEYLSEQEFKLLSWPAQSPDINPIENCWSYLKQQLNKYERPPNGMKELYERIQFEWEKISKDYLLKLYESMPRRIRCY
jgi:transposase